MFILFLVFVSGSPLCTCLVYSVLVLWLYLHVLFFLKCGQQSEFTQFLLCCLQSINVLNRFWSAVYSANLEIIFVMDLMTVPMVQMKARLYVQVCTCILTLIYYCMSWVQSNLYIKGTEGDMKKCSFINRFKLYTLFIKWRK